MTHWRRRHRLEGRDLKHLAFWLVVSVALAIIAHIVVNDLGPVPPTINALHP